MKKIISLFALAFLALGLVACGGGDDMKKLEEAAERLDINGWVAGGDANNVTSQFTVPTALINNVVATWESDDSVYGEIKDVGEEGFLTVVVDRPIGTDRTVKLTATLKLNSTELEKELSFKIPALSEDTVEMTKIAELRAAETIVGLNFKMTNMTVVNVDEDAYYVMDEDGDVMLVYNSPSGIVKNSKGTLIAVGGINYDSVQGTKAAFVLKELNVTSTPNQVSLDKYDFFGKDAAEIKAAKNSPEYIKLIQFDAVVVLRNDFTGGGNYMMTFVDPVKAKANLDDSFVLSYYKSTLHASLNEYNGKIVTVVATIRELRDSRATTEGNAQPVWSVSVVSLEEKSEAIGNDVKAAIATTVKIVQDYAKAPEAAVDLPTANGEGTSLAWSVVGETTLVSIADNKLTVTPEAGLRNPATIRVTATVGDKTATRDFEIMVGDYVDKTFTEVLGETINKTDVIRIEGVITYVETGDRRCFFMVDSDGKFIYVRPDVTGDYPGKDLTVVGNKVKIVGTKGLYNGLVQFVPKVVTKEAENQTLPNVIDLTALANLNDQTANISSIVTITGTLAGSNRKFTVTTEGGLVVTLYTNSSSITVDASLVGKQVVVTAGLGYSDFDHGTNLAQGTNAAKLQISISNAAQIVEKPAA